MREAEDHIRAHQIAIGVEADLLQILLRRVVPVAAVVGQRQTLLEEPAAEWMADGPNSDACGPVPGQVCVPQRRSWAHPPSTQPLRNTNLTRHRAASVDSLNIS